VHIVWQQTPYHLESIDLQVLACPTRHAVWGYKADMCRLGLCSAVLCRRFIWITGWSVWVDTMLKRTPMADQNSPHLGELLKQKADAGVKVGRRPLEPASVTDT